MTIHLQMKEYTQRHKTGTSYEVHPDGTQTEIVKGDHYTLFQAKGKKLQVIVIYQ